VIRAILFDWHGVITNKPFLEWARKATESEAVVQGLLALADHVDAGTITLAELHEYAGNLVDLAPEAVRQGIAAEVRVNTELMELINNELRTDLRVGVLSNINSEFLYAVMNEHHLMSSFSLALASSDLKVTKPDARIFQAALKPLHCAADQVAFVDDTEGHVLAAQRLGIHGVLYESVSQLREALAGQDLLR
jgi:FMN phosphatase YigB (HAD superfamily)